MQEANLLIPGFKSLQYVTNPYALVGFVFLIWAVSISFVKVPPRIKAGLLLVFASLVIGVASYLSLKTSFDRIKDESLVHIVRDGGRVVVADGIEVELVDIESLKGKSNWTFNSNLPDIQHILDVVLPRASVKQVSVRDLNEAKWTKLMVSLEESEKIKAEIIEDTSFAKFHVFVDGVEDTNFESKYFFKNEYLCIPFGTEKEGCPKARLQVVNLYNTVHHSSGEPEAANLRLIRK